MTLRLPAGFVLVVLLSPIPPAAAQPEHDCRITFNGVSPDRIDSIGSPLELDADDSLIASGSDPVGTRSTRVTLSVGPVQIASRSTSVATPSADFTASIALDEVSPYGVGLLHAELETDGCRAAVWIRLSGRFPLTTLIGLTATGLALGGATGQLGAIAVRRRWARAAAALGGAATGSGLALVGQQFGRFQISYPSLGGSVVLTGLIGFVLATVLNPSYRPRPNPPIARRRPLPGPAPRTSMSSPDRAAGRPDRAGPDEAQPTTRPAWCYVLADTDVYDLEDHQSVVGSLKPGTWYLALRTAGGWSHVVVGDGTEGWVAYSSLHRRA